MKGFFLSLFRKLNSRKASRGFGLVETVIAMVVIGVVTASALSIVLSANVTYAKEKQKQEAQYTVDAALECFKFSDDYGEDSQFANAMSLYNIIRSDDELFTYTYDASFQHHIYRYTRHGYSVEIRITEAAEGGRDYFRAAIIDPETNGEKWSLEYYKGGLAT